MTRRSSSGVYMDAPRWFASRPWANLLESIFFRRYKCFVSESCERVFYIRKSAKSYHVIPVTTLCFFIWSVSYLPPALPFTSPAPLSHQQPHLDTWTSYAALRYTRNLGKKMTSSTEKCNVTVIYVRISSQKLKIHQTRLHAHSVLVGGLLLQNDDGVNMS